ncbi:MAG: CPBP family intramembrane metalloprotease [Pirellulales bacterium]|nr:CPBP family intramembrane metalloprotease [Pirellulales bacterium]
MNVTNHNLPGVANFAVTAAAFEGGLAIFALSLGWAMDSPPMASFQWSWMDLGWGMIATLPPLALLGMCLFPPWEPLRRILRLLNESILPLFRECGIFEIAVIAFLAGLGEEMLFRPIVQDGVSRWIGGPYGPAIGLCVAAVIFGLLHGLTVAYAILAGVIGLYLGGIWLLSGNLLVPITAHALYDFLAIVVLLRMEKPLVIEKNDE